MTKMSSLGSVEDAAFGEDASAGATAVRSLEDDACREGPF